MGSLVPSSAFSTPNRKSYLREKTMSTLSFASRTYKRRDRYLVSKQRSILKKASCGLRTSIEVKHDPTDYSVHHGQDPSFSVAICGRPTFKRHSASHKWQSLRAWLRDDDSWRRATASYCKTP